MDNIIKFNVKLSNIEKINPLFSKCKIRVLYTGLNRNNTFITKEAVMDAIPSIFNVPIIGEYYDDADNFGGHGGKIDVSGDRPKWVNTTFPYGLIPESADVYWETVTEDTGEENEYLVVDNAFLWTGRYPEAKMLIGQEFNQSMEIEIQKGSYTTIDGQKTYEIQNFIFSALCILGISKNSDPGGHVEPCFESSSIIAYELDKDKFKSEFNQMVSELKFSLTKSTSFEDDINKNNDIQGGNEVDKILEMLAQYNLTIDDLQAKGINHEDFSLEELEEKVKSDFAQTNEDGKSVNADDDKQTFALTGSQLFEEVAREINTFGMVDFYGYEFPRYALVDVDTENGKVITQDYENWYLVGFDYSVSGDKVNIAQESVKRFKVNYSPMDLETEANFSTELFKKFAEDIRSKAEEKITSEYQIKLAEKDSELSNQAQKYTELQEQFAQVSEQYSAKLEEERETKETELFSSFSSELTEEEMKEVKEKRSEYSLDELQDKLFALVGKKKARFSFEKHPAVIDLNTDEPKHKKPGKSYDVLFDN
ncbi:hypothetical protein [Paenibacillus sp. ISL-20]|uniref:hypothetical protein n=1 Tax=Paenibacillus sp. ISL-20 TaxID=2819163 RepID=UPI001BE8EBA3|nr:hypothetical protein [Paenibacillus sp. ISL-20]MBT2759857.1 hypothetical protein [Paenibacillus sp. ISL-20]